MKRWNAFALTVVFVLSGCSNKEPVAQQQEAAKPAAPAAPALPEPQPEFTDPAKQQAYASSFRECLTMFEPPETGLSIWLTLTDGGRVLGTILDSGPDFITVKTAHHEAKLTAPFIVGESRARIFQADFARAHALARVNGEASPPAVPATAAFVRHALCNNIRPRVGPGNEFRRVAATSYARGQALTICGETNDWIEVQTPEKESHQWLPRFLTYDLEELNLTARQRDLDVLKKIGLIETIQPEQNAFTVDPGMWSTMDEDMRVGITRAMAAYCAAERKKTTVFVTVFEAKTQAKLGKYSDSLGWVPALH